VGEVVVLALNNGQNNEWSAGWRKERWLNKYLWKTKV